MTKNNISPPGPLLHAGTAAPEASTVVAEVRSDASVPFNPHDAPPFFNLAAGNKFGAFVVWRVDLSWADAQRVQLWLLAAPAGGIAASQEEALKDLIENLVAPDPDNNNQPSAFATYLGTFLTSDISHASYTVLIGLLRPVPRDVYQKAWADGVNGASGAAWFPQLLDFLRLMLAQPTSEEDFIQLARNVGDLKAVSGGTPVFPLINLLIP